MNKLIKIIKCKVWGVLAAVLCSLFAVLLVVGTVASRYTLQLNDALGIVTQEIINKDDDIKYFPRDCQNETELKEYTHSVAKQLEEEGAVLLKNDVVGGKSALPLDQGSSVTCLFNGSVNFNYSSSGSSASTDIVNVDLKTALTDVGLNVNGTLWDFYTTGAAKDYKRNMFGVYYNINEAPWSVYTQTVKDAIGGVALFTVSRDSGEGKDISVTNTDGKKGKDYLSLSEEESGVLREVTSLKKSGKVDKIVVLLNTSSAFQLDFLYADDIDVDACMWVGNVGCEGIRAVAELLVGKDGISPSGKLSDTLLKDNFSSPAMKLLGQTPTSFTKQYSNKKEKGLSTSQSNYVVYAEGIYVGYRYYETRYEDYVTGRANTGAYAYSDDVAYPFGYGKSYAEFEYGDVSVTPSSDGKTFEVKVSVTNTSSDRTAKEAVQVYLQKPYTQYDEENGIEKASVELVAFDKKEIAAGKTVEYTLTVEKSLFKSYDSNGEKTYILDAGNYYLTAAPDAHTAVNNILAKKGKTPDNTDGRMDAEGNADAVYEWNNPALDVTTYSVSEYTGEKITNRFDFADMNRYDGKGSNSVTYVSRSNWTDTMPEAPISFSVATDKMMSDLTSNKPLDDSKSNDNTYGKSSDLTLYSLRGLSYYGDDSRELWDELLDSLTWEDQVELVTSGYFTTVGNAKIVKPETKEADGPVGVSSGSAAGVVFPCEGIWASTFNVELIQKTGDAFAEDALASGLSGVYAGGANIHRTPYGGRSAEYFSEDPYLSAMAIQYEVIGLQKKGVVAHVKHIAFNEQETNRAGLGTWLNEQSAREIYLLPFEYALSESRGRAGAVMSAFNRVGCVWAGASGEMLIDLIHGEWDFYGYNITDMASSDGAQFMTYVDGLPNGTDLYLKSTDMTAYDAYRNNGLVADRLREATHRILYTIANRSVVMNGIGPNTRLMLHTPWWKTTLTAVTVVVGVIGGMTALVYLVGFADSKFGLFEKIKKLVAKKKEKTDE